MSLTIPTRLLLATLLSVAMVPAPALEAQVARASSSAATEVQQFQQIEDNWSIAFVKKDQYGMELLLSPTFVDISAAGAISTRNQLIAQMFDHSAGDLLSMEQRVVNVRVLGDVAVVEGTYVIHYQAAGAHTVDERGIFTHVYQRSRAGWACIHAQRTVVYDETDEKARQSGKKSPAALPFHVPLLYKGAQSAQPAATQPAPDKQPPQ